MGFLPWYPKHFKILLEELYLGIQNGSHFIFPPFQLFFIVLVTVSALFSSPLSFNTTSSNSPRLTYMGVASFPSSLFLSHFPNLDQRLTQQWILGSSLSVSNALSFFQNRNLSSAQMLPPPSKPTPVTLFSTGEWTNRTDGKAEWVMACTWEEEKIRKCYVIYLHWSMGTRLRIETADPT